MCLPEGVQVGHNAAAGRGGRRIFAKSLRAEELSVQLGTHKAVEFQQ